MDWKEKTKMVQLGNKIKDQETNKEFFDFVKGKFDQFDKETWQMFADSVVLLPEFARGHEDVINEAKNTFKDRNFDVGFVRGIRLETLFLYAENNEIL